MLTTEFFFSIMRQDYMMCECVCGFVNTQIKSHCLNISKYFITLSQPTAIKNIDLNLE